MASNDPQVVASGGVLDTLLTSINTEASGLTSNSLQQSVAAMDVRRDEVFHTLLSRTQEACTNPSAAAPDALAQEAAYAAAVASLADQGLTEGFEPLAHAAAVASQHAAVVTELQTTLASVAEVGALAGLQQRLAEYDSIVSQGAFSDASRLILELHAAVASVSGAEPTAAAVEERLQLLKDYVITAPPQYLVIDPATHLPSLIPPAQQTGAALGQVWAAAAALGELSNSLLQLSSFLVEYCIKPILAAEVAANASAAIMESPAGSIASSALSAATTARGGTGRGPGAERALYKCLKAICDGPLGGHVDMANRMGQSFWPTAAGAYIAVKLNPLKPAADAELAAFMRAGSLAVKLEQKAVKLGLWPANAEGPIAKFVRVTVGRTLAKKRVKYATAARALLTSDGAKESIAVSGAVPTSRPGSASSASRALFGGAGAGTNNVAAVAAAELSGEPPIGDVGPYCVSKAAEGLVSLMNDALGESCRSGSAALAQAMCGAVVDLASLLLALESSAAGSDQERLVPFVAALRYNDCMHVYRTLCMLPQIHSPRLQTLVHPAVNFIAPARRVREAGEAALSAMIAQQQAELLEIARELQRWRGLDGPGVIRCNKIARQLLMAFQRLGGVLRGVLPHEAFIKTTAILSNTVCGTIADAILTMGDISEEESQQIPEILGVLTAPGTGILAAAATGGGAAGPAPGGAPPPPQSDLAGQLEAEAREVSRLREVCELLDVPSREIALRWRSGRLAAAGLTKQQVVGLVKALFEDNNHSRASLNAILEYP